MSNSRRVLSLFCIVALTIYVSLFLYGQSFDSTDIRQDCNSQKQLRYDYVMSYLNRKKVSADDWMLVELLRRYYILPPALAPYNLSFPQRQNPSPGQTQFIDEMLNYKHNGFFVDSGAYDGEYLSNSLFLERYRNWTGILIEPNPMTYESLKGKNRKCHTLNACLSIKPFPVSESFYTGKKAVRDKIVTQPHDVTTKDKAYIKVQCFPLFSVLLALNQLSVDYFSLDVEGAELGVLENIPWNKIDIKTFSIEHNKWKGGKQNLTAYMRSKGYDLKKEIKVNVAPDLIFMKRKPPKTSK